MERMPIWQIALRRIEMPVPRFLSLYVAPIVVATFLISIVLVYLTGGLAEGALFSGFTGVFLVILLTTMSALAATSRRACHTCSRISAPARLACSPIDPV